MIIRGLDWVTPVLVREYQQVVRSRNFQLMCIIWLVAQLFVSLIYISNIDPTQASMWLRGPGQEYFTWIMAALGIIFLLALPFSTFNRLTREHRERTLELLVITGITPRQVALGFLGVTITQMLLFLFMSFPFVSFAYLFRGLEMSAVFWWLYFMTLAALSANAISLMLASFCRTPRTASSMRVLFLVGTFIVLGPLLLAFAELIFRPHRGSIFMSVPTGRDAWIFSSLGALMAAATVTTSLVFTRSNLLFESANRTTLPRLTISGMFTLGGGVLLALGAMTGHALSEEIIMAYAVLSLAITLLYACLLFSESNTITPRMAESIPRHRFLRLLALPFLPGNGTAFLYVVFNFGLILFLATAALNLSGASLGGDEFGLLLMVPYSLFFLGFPCLLQRWVRNTKLRKVYYPVWLLIWFNIVLWTPLIWTKQISFTSPFSTFPINASDLSDPNWRLTLAWRGFVAPLLGCLAAVPTIRQNLQNIRNAVRP